MGFLTPKALRWLLAAALAALVFELILSESAEAQLCKWVDENGTVHYAERCPDDIEGNTLELEEGPSEADIRSAQERADRSKAARLGREADEALDIDEDQSLDSNAAMDRAIECVSAMRDLRILNLTLAVFYDENGKLHYNRSYYDQSYRGPRQYISDEDRPAVIAATRRRIDRNCGDSEEELARQRIASATLLQADVCGDWRNRVEKLRRSRSPGSRDMASWLEDRCR